MVITSPNIDKVIKSLDKWPRKAPRVIGKHWRPVSNKVHKKLVRVTTRNLHRRTGTLARGWVRPRMHTAQGLVTVNFVNEAIYATIHEFGGTITAKGKLLAIPLTAAKTSAGVARVSPGDLPGKQTFVRNRIIFFKKSKTDKRPTPMFKLQESVTIPPRLNATGVILSSQRPYSRGIEKAVEELWSEK